jgi:putative Mg2+ transporter-C (MgtC) family protein
MPAHRPRWQDAGRVAYSWITTPYRSVTIVEWQPQLEILGKLAIAMLLGGLIGVEREMLNKPAGFRTHMLVAGSAALLVMLGDVLIDHFRDEEHTDVLRSDPIRIVEAIVTGISFLGAGTIFRRREGEAVEGLTTGAALLYSGAIGISVALGQYALAAGATLLGLAVLRGISVVERRLHRPSAETGRP